MADVIALNTTPREPTGATVVVCSVDGQDITMPADPSTGQVLTVLRQVRKGQMTRFDVLDFLEHQIGSENLDKILASDISQEQFDQISSRVLVIALGGDPDAEVEDGADPGNGKAEPLRSVG